MWKSGFNVTVDQSPGCFPGYCQLQGFDLSRKVLIHVQGLFNPSKKMWWFNHRLKSDLLYFTIFSELWLKTLWYWNRPFPIFFDCQFLHYWATCNLVLLTWTCHVVSVNVTVYLQPWGRFASFRCNYWSSPYHDGVVHSTLCSCEGHVSSDMMLIAEGWQNENVFICSKSVSAVFFFFSSITCQIFIWLIQSVLQ